MLTFFSCRVESRKKLGGGDSWGKAELVVVYPRSLKAGNFPCFTADGYIAATDLFDDMELMLQSFEQY